MKTISKFPDVSDPVSREVTRKICVLYWAKPKGSPYEYRINMWRYAMGLNDTVDIVMGYVDPGDHYIAKRQRHKEEYNMFRKPIKDIKSYNENGSQHNYR